MNLTGKSIPALFSLFMASCAYAGSFHPEEGPHLSGPLIQSINMDRSHYDEGNIARLFIHLNNRTGGNFSGSITATVTGRGRQVRTPIVRSVDALPQGQEMTVELDVPTTPMSSYQGYHVVLDATSSGRLIDEQATAIDFSPDWWTYPRQCWLVGAFSDWGEWKPEVIYGTSPEKNVSSLNAYHCNNLQFYNLLYRWHQPWSNEERYVNGDGETVEKPLMRRAMATAKALHMGSFFYFPLYAANIGIKPAVMEDGSGASISWGLFTNQCGLNGGTCSTADMKKFYANIGYMNPNNTEWQYYWAQQANKIIHEFGFDGIFIDTYGGISEALYDAQGRQVDFSHAYSSFITTVTGLTNAPMTLNPAGSWNEQDLVQSRREVFHFNERWNNPSDVGNFGDFWTRAQQIQSWASSRPHGIGMDWDLGMNKGPMQDKNCAINGGARYCTFNLPGVLYQEAAIMATGAHHDWIVDGQQSQGDGARFISNDDYPIGNMLPLPAGMAQAEYDYQSFGVAYEKLLRRDVRAPSLPAASITSGGSGSTTAQAGKIWLLQTTRPGFDMLHLLNYQQMNSASFNDVNDNAANAAAPQTTGPLSVKMYVTSGSALGWLFWASPDVRHGAPQTISYSPGQDSNGTYITFTLPSLSYWDMVWLENNVASSDYAVP
ncbi:glycoside hydrolase family 66 protein [Bombella sp. TMW 2.2543]|uniref:Glycoside hydrolase family 66 protein n=1 Tax=Bombella pluederhausensis TaxID=2967336 RepID=A0ABT3WEQ6_9PROT|nr:glycoside hydrolase family 66 protein [Bombella pluederhausensis]MCX5617592.1 glycoside hydrolase family 66 protein [Bombella pluederhausensis]